MADDEASIMAGHVTGIGGIFFKCDDPTETKAWYGKTLGFPVTEYGTSFPFREDDDPDKRGYVIHSPFGKDNDYFKPSDKDFMVNFRVRDLDGMVEKLIAAGIEMVGEPESHPYGKFAWIMDPNGIKLELWEQVGPPPDEAE